MHISPALSEGRAELTSGSVDCVVVRPPIRTMPLTLCLATLAERLGSHDLPMIIYAPEPLDAEAEGQLTKAAQTLTIKGVMSAEGLTDEVTLHLHWPLAQLSAAKQQIFPTFY